VPPVRTPARARSGTPAARAAVLSLLLCLAVSGCTVVTVEPPPTQGPVPSVPAPPGRISAAAARARLDQLEVRSWSSMRGYSRQRFQHWRQREDGCNTRELVLRRSGEGVRADSSCRVRSGRWVSPYDGAVHSRAADLDIDHMIPLANAWRSGADRWTDAQRERFANDLTTPELVAVTGTVNRSKGDQGPEEWKPPLQGYWCSYGRDWVAVKHRYRLSVTAAEKSALARMLARC
jgi:hypothetical protein